MKKTKQEKFLEKQNKYNLELTTLILYPGFANRVSISELFKKLEPYKLITGRKCTGERKVKNKNTGKFETMPKYSNCRYFVEFKNKQRLSVSSFVFRWLKTEEKLPHSYENYYA